MPVPRGPQLSWPALIAAAALSAGCGSARSTTITQVKTATVTAPAHTAPGPSGELLAVPAVGRIYGRCTPGEAHWTIRFLNDALATDTLTARVGSGPALSRELNPGQTVVWTLTPGQSTSREPADAASHSPAAVLKTTAPLSLNITQGTEPHIYRVSLRFAVAAAVGDPTICALIASHMSATTYYPGGQPPS